MRVFGFPHCLLLKPLVFITIFCQQTSQIQSICPTSVKALRCTLGTAWKQLDNQQPRSRTWAQLLQLGRQLQIQHLGHVSCQMCSIYGHPHCWHGWGENKSTANFTEGTESRILIGMEENVLDEGLAEFGAQETAVKFHAKKNEV